MVSYICVHYNVFQMEAWRQTLPRQRSGEILCRGSILVKFPAAAAF
jgi:hypothetical protein